MSKVKVVDCVFRLKDAYQLKIGTDVINLEKNQELHIVSDVIYMNGYPIPHAMQRFFIDFVMDNKSLFTLDNRTW
jgi:hypothetical protein